MHSPIRIGKTEQDMGICAMVMCPHCQTVSRFSLRHISAAVKVLEQPLFEFGGSYQLLCNSCKFRKDLDDAELSAAKEAERLYEQFEVSSILWTSGAEWQKKKVNKLCHELTTLTMPRFASRRWNCYCPATSLNGRLPATWAFALRPCARGRSNTRPSRNSGRFPPPRPPRIWNGKTNSCGASWPTLNASVKS